MFTTENFFIIANWSSYVTMALVPITILAFYLKWGLRFRLVGATGFMVVLTSGLFVLSLVPLTRTFVPNSVRYSLVYDNGGAITVISLPPTITATELEATLQQAAADLFSYGRGGGASNQLYIRARTIIHPEPGISEPLTLGEVRRSLANRSDVQMDIRVYPENLAKLPNAAT